MRRFETIIITGSRKGIGRHLTENYLSKGYNVAGCSRGPSELEHSNYLHFECDVADEKAVKQMITQVKKTFGSIDILINNAGIASMNSALLTPGETVTKIFATNFNGSFFFARECAKKMIRQKNGGRIVNLSTIAVPLDLEGELIYASSKAAVEKMTRILSKELANYGITVNTLGPTPVETDLIKTLSKDKIDALIEKQPIKRLGEFRDIENVVDFFINQSSDFITGQTLYLGGL